MNWLNDWSINQPTDQTHTHLMKQERKKQSHQYINKMRKLKLKSTQHCIVCNIRITTYVHHIPFVNIPTKWWNVLICFCIWCILLQRYYVCECVLICFVLLCAVASCVRSFVFRSTRPRWLGCYIAIKNKILFSVFL